MIFQEKRKYGEMAHEWSWRTRLKLIVGAVILGMIIYVLVGQIGNPWSIKETPDDSTKQKINALSDQASEVPEFISADFASSPDTPICAAVDLRVLTDYEPDELMEWSEMWFNDRRLPSEEVSITLRDVEGYWGPYTENRVWTTRPALQICFKRGLISNEGHGQMHLLRISVHDSFVHEVLSYEWVFKSCLCR